jgi:hypothetical protein
LQQERLAVGDAGELRLQRARLAGEDQWRRGAQFGLDGGKRVCCGAGSCDTGCAGAGEGGVAGLRSSGTDGPVITSKSKSVLCMRASFG